MNDINYNILINQRKSNFYDLLDKYPKVTRVSFAALDSIEKVKIFKRFVQKEEFNQFFLVTDDLQTIVWGNTIIEIITPVLKKRKIQMDRSLQW